MQADNPRLPHLTIRAISLGFERLRNIQPIAWAGGKLSTDDGRVKPVKADLTSLLTVAKNKRRRDALDILTNTEGGEISLSDLAEEVASREYDCAVDDLAGEERKRVYIAFKQCHLKRLEDADLVEVGEHDTPITATEDTAPAAEIISDLETVTGGDF